MMTEKNAMEDLDILNLYKDVLEFRVDHFNLKTLEQIEQLVVHLNTLHGDKITDVAYYEKKRIYITPFRFGKLNPNYSATSPIYHPKSQNDFKNPEFVNLNEGRYVVTVAYSANCTQKDINQIRKSIASLTSHAAFIKQQMILKPIKIITG